MLMKGAFEQSRRKYCDRRSNAFQRGSHIGGRVFAIHTFTKEQTVGFALAPATTGTATNTISQATSLKNGRGGEIRTPDPLFPKQMRYQAALRPGPWRVFRRVELI